MTRVDHCSLSPLYGMQHVEIPSKQIGPPPIHRTTKKGVKEGGREKKRRGGKEEPKRERKGKSDQKPNYASQRDNDKTIQVAKKKKC